MDDWFHEVGVVDTVPQPRYAIRNMKTQPRARQMLILFLLGYFVACQADTTIKTRTVVHSTNPNTNLQNPEVQLDVYYRSGSMRRKDSAGGHSILSTLVNCESRKGFLVDMNAYEYKRYDLPTFWSETQFQEYLKTNPRKAIHVHSHTSDTGERKMFFGREAKHLVTKIIRTADKNNAGGEEVIDGWYIDHESADSQCLPDFAHTSAHYLLETILVAYPEVPRFQHRGPLPTGLAVKLNRTVSFADRKGNVVRTITLERTVEDLTDSPLSPTLFKLPVGARENPQMLGGKPSSRD
jgi:hypothetical protein